MAQRYDDTPIDFAGLAQALLARAPTLVAQWLPAGFERAGRWYCGDFDGAEGESANVNLKTGQWIDNGGTEDDRGGDLTSLYARIHGLNNGQAARELMEQLGWERSRRRDNPPSGPAPSAASGKADNPGPGQAEAAQPADEGDPGPWAGADARTAAAAGGKRRSMWRAIVPVPRNAPTPGFQFKFHDRKLDNWTELEPVRTWRYEFEGELFGYTARFERFNSKGELVKDVMPRTWCVDESDDRGTHRWHWKQWEAPRPLYVPAGLLSGDLSLPVVVVEGEKCAEAGHKLLGHEFDFVSWPGGGKAWPQAGFGWLMGRQVILWPDCDAQREALTKAEREAGADPATKPLKAPHRQPGMQTMVGIGSHLLADQACTVRICQIPAPGDAPNGWDLADAIEQGWDAERVRAFLLRAQPFVAPDDAARAKAGQAVDPEKKSRSGATAKDQGEGAGGGDDDDASIAWRKYLLTTAKGSIAPARENVVLALDGWPERKVPGIPEVADLIRFNEFSNNVEKTRATPWGTSAGPWLESDELQMGDWLVRQHWLPSMSRGTLEEAVLIVAHRHACHPVRERMLALRGRWDGEPRLRHWLRMVCLAEGEYDETDPLQVYLSLAGKWFVMAMVARVLPEKKLGPRVVIGPGTKFDYMLILEGKQGVGKSTLAATLGGEYFADTGLVLGEKDSYQNIQGVHVYEWGELENMSKQEVSRVKLFVSSPKDRFRASFDKRPRDYPRQVVFIGTTNEAHYLADMTGNRRFWPVRVTREPDNAWLAENMDQLFAEALVCLDSGERFWPTRDEQRDLFDPQQQARKIESSLEGAIRAFLYDEEQKVPHGKTNGALLNQIGMTELLDRVGYTLDKQTDVVVKRAAAVMHALGWPLVRLGSKGRPYVYQRPENDEYDRPAVQRASPGSDPSTGSTQSQPDEDLDECPF